MVKATVLRRSDAEQLAGLLDSSEVATLVAELEATRWTGRRGYSLRSLVGMALVKTLHAIPTWTRTVALVADHAALRVALGCADLSDVPSIDACYRFTARLRRFQPLLDNCIAAVVAGLRAELPEYGQDIAIDGSDLPAYANGQRYVSKGGRERERFSDPDASWGHRSAVSTRKGGGYYGYKLHAAVCTATDLPVAWDVRTAKDAEVPVVPELLDAMVACGLAPETCAMDKGYDAGAAYDACEARGVRVPWRPAHHSPAPDALRGGWQGCAAVLRARYVDLRWGRR